ncbi:C-type lectin domain family 12 member B-like isoform X4 [Elephas maximus indicus]|uniref:C-type lectin domain family 12 member B-like isoform X4 n=1 Tax=Elephas maximus indicus TaxID=99487 RepID=UPI00211714B1|nr:C-type lectin domain family 12 member B-like isoform X4 [Elephas maximus indicus]
MPEEVTYATLKFPNPSKTKTLQESYSQKKTDNQEAQELELHGEAETGTERIEGTVKVSKSRDYKEFIGCTNHMTSELPESQTEQLRRNLTFYMEMFNNVSSEHSIFKNKSENEIRELKDLASKNCEDLKQEGKDHTCSELWISHGDKCYYFSTTANNFSEMNNSDCRMNHSYLMHINSEINTNRTQLFICCLPSSDSLVDLNCTLNKKN